MFVSSQISASAPSLTQRSSMLAIVLGLHAILLALMMTHKTILPKVVELPLVVDLIEAIPLPVSPVAAPAAPQPVIAPQPVPKPKPQKKIPTPRPKPQQPQLEATASSEPAGDNAPVQEAVPPDTEPAPTGGGGSEGQGSAGSGLVQARFDADYLLNPAPPYPPMSRRMGEEGRVVLRVRVSAAGTAEQVEIRTSSGSARLDESARRTVRAWKFIPAKRGGIPVESWVLVPIHFRLEQ